MRASYNRLRANPMCKWLDWIKQAASDRLTRFGHSLHLALTFRV